MTDAKLDTAMDAKASTKPDAAPAAKADAQAARVENITDASPAGRKLVIFADGTGNAFSTQESNVWRLYEALDRTKPDQVAFYIKGVGTAGWKPLALLDGATGLGVPGNVRALYRFLCWNWKPGDKIYIFGFSRGAFTARALAGLITKTGLMPAVIGEKAVSEADMRRNALSAWRAYRSASVGWQSLPTVWLSRGVRDVVVGAWRALWGRPSYDDLRAIMAKDTETKPERRRDGVEVEFLGLFDTVEAFGVPIEELRVAIDWTIWPISFRNYVVNGKVKRVRHALALDDERTSFHPLRIDQSQETPGSNRIREVWFAGVHSDVGGGYPDGNLAYVPLAWMAGQVEEDLRFQDGRLDHFRRYQSAIGPAHDSRGGGAIVYRYGPRVIEGNTQDGGPPVVHHSVVTRMQEGCDNYAPIMLPANAKVWLPGPGGQVADLTEQPQQRAGRAMETLPDVVKQDGARMARAEAAIAAIKAMPQPDADISRQTLDTVWWRRIAYFCLLWSLVLVALWPFIAGALIEKVGEASADAGASGIYKTLAVLNDKLVSMIDTTVTVLKGFVPSFAHSWLTTARDFPIATILLAVIVFGAWTWNNTLREKIRARARLAWFRPGRKVAPPATWSIPLAFAHALRTNTVARKLHKLFTRFVFPAFALLLFAYVVLVAGGRSYFNYYSGRDTELCRSGGSTPVSTTIETAKTSFDTKSMCWGSGLVVEKDRKYRIFITMEQPWFDRTIMSGANGFTLYTPAHIAALPIRRWFAADWFQPIVRFGNWGTDELALTSVDGTAADKLPRWNIAGTARRAVRVDQTQEFIDARNRLLPGKTPPGSFAPIEPEMLPTATEIWTKQELNKTFVADFIAAESGELYLYLNDAVQIFPFAGKLDRYYGNNTGTARVQVQRVPLPEAK